MTIEMIIKSFCNQLAHGMMNQTETIKAITDVIANEIESVPAWCRWKTERQYWRIAFREIGKACKALDSH